MYKHRFRKRRYNNSKGYFAEIFAAVFLTVKGYRILARRYKTKSGEIDIIALRGRRLAFVEVKVRSSLEKALDALTLHQEKRIIRASKYWVSKNQYYRDCDIEFDYVVVIPWNIPYHFLNFFRE